MSKPTVAAIRAAKSWRDLDLNGPINQPGSPTGRLAAIIDTEFSDVVEALRAVTDRLADRFGADATNRIDSDVISQARAALAKLDGGTEP